MDDGLPAGTWTMGLIVRCWWLPGQSMSLAERMAEVVPLIQRPDLSEILGTEWFRKGRSKREALAKPAHIEDCCNGERPWRKVSLTDLPPHTKFYHALGLWNGREPPAAADFSITLYDPAFDEERRGLRGLETDSLVMIGPEVDFLETMGLSWTSVVRMGKELAETLGGRVELTSHELWKQADGLGLRNADGASYAAFWGGDRSGKNPLYESLLRRGVDVPFAATACNSWRDVANPPPARLQEVADLIAGS